MTMKAKRRADRKRATLDVANPVVVVGIVDKSAASSKTRTLVDVSLMSSKFHDPAEVICAAISEALDPATAPITRDVSVDVAELRGPMESPTRARLRFIRARAAQLCRLANDHGCQPCPLCSTSVHAMVCAVEDRPTIRGLTRNGHCAGCGGRWERKVRGTGWWFNMGGRVPTARAPLPDDPPGTIDRQATKRRRIT